MPKVSRNAPCPCGSGRKYKKCCLQKDQEEARRPKPVPDGQEPEPRPDWIPHDDWGDDTEGEPEPEAHRRDGYEREAHDGNGRRSGSPYPQIDLDLPTLPEADQAIVDKWWDDFMPVYEKRDADEMIRRIVDFMEAQPTLFVHLALDEECLFELGDELARRGECARHVALLQRIREEHPEVYIRRHGFYDEDIVAELLLTGQRDAIPEYFSFFRQYPDSHPDGLSKLIGLLLAANCQEAVFDLARATAVPCMCSPEVFGGDFVFRWYLFEQWVPFLDRGDASEDACKELIEAMEAMELPDDITFKLERVTRPMGWTFERDPATHIGPLCQAQGMEDFYVAVAWSFTRFLHETRGMTWATARSFADRLQEYLCSLLGKKRTGHPFVFEQNRLDRYMAQSFMSFFSLDGLRAISLLQAVYEFTGYLEANPVGTSAPPGKIRQTCVRLFETCRKAAGPPDAGARIFADFPEYRWAT